jgi:hypothetical protein
LNAAEPQVVRRPLPSPIYYPGLKDFNKYFDMLITNDYEARLAVFLTCLSAYTDEPLNLFLRGESSTGKTWITTNVTELFPPEDVWSLGGMSPKSVIHEHGIMVDPETGEPIDLLVKPSEKDKEAYLEYRRKIMNAVHVVDLSKKIAVFLEAPPRETFDMLRPILSHDKYEIEYRFVDKTGKGRLATMRTIVRGWPATIFCTPRIEYLEELATRSFTVSPQVSEEKTRNANMVTARLSSDPSFKQMVEKAREPLRSYIRFIRDFDCKIVIPFAKVLAEDYPVSLPRAMRDFKHLLGFVKASALLNAVRRPCIYGDGKTMLLASVKDVETAFKLFGASIRETTYGIPSVVLSFYELLEAKHGDGDFTVSDAETLWNFENPKNKKSRETLKKWLYALESANLVSSEPDPEDKRRMRYHVLKTEKLKITVYSGNPGFLDRFSLRDFQNWLRINSVIGNGKIMHISPLSPFSKTPVDVYNRIMSLPRIPKKFKYTGSLPDWWV